MTKTERLIRRAAQIAGGGSSATAGSRAEVCALELEKRLATYREAVKATKDQDPPCPDCWLGYGEELAMTLITSDWPDEHLYGCMICGFEESFPTKAVRFARRESSTRGAARAA